MYDPGRGPGIRQGRLGVARRCAFSTAVFFALLTLASCGSSPASNTSAAATTTVATSPAYPPTTVGDLKALARSGDSAVVHEVRSEGTGLATCPQPRRSVIVAASVTDPKPIAAALLNYFYAQALDNDCGAVVLAYANQGEVDQGPYTVGQVALTVSSSAPRHDLTVIIGNDLGATSLSFEV